MTITHVTLGDGPAPADDPAPTTGGPSAPRPAAEGHRWWQRAALVGAAAAFVGIAVGVGSLRGGHELAPLGALASAVERNDASPAAGVTRTVSTRQTTNVVPVAGGADASIIEYVARDVTLDADGLGTLTETLTGYDFPAEDDRQRWLEHGLALPEVGRTTTQPITTPASTNAVVAAASDPDALDAYLAADDNGAGLDATRFRNGIDALRETNLPPATRATLLRELSGERNVVQQAHVADSLGRDAVSVVSTSDHFGIPTRTTAWLDATTGVLLQVDVETLTPAPVLVGRSVYLTN